MRSEACHGYCQVEEKNDLGNMISEANQCQSHEQNSLIKRNFKLEIKITPHCI